MEPTGKVLSVREDTERGIVIVAGLTQQQVTSTENVLQLLTSGNKHRKTEATMANQVSSRSHAVLQLIVKHKSRSNNGQEVLNESILSMIDLAGSERASATNNTGTRLQEGANINKSLLALANCINALSTGANSSKKCNVKYRDSKLTHLLKSSLEGKCNLIMIANINPSHLTFEDSHNTLKYANRAKNIKVNPMILDTNQSQVELTWVEREMNLIEENKALREKIEELQEIINELKRNQKKSSKCICGLVSNPDEIYDIDGLPESKSENDNNFSNVLPIYEQKQQNYGENTTFKYNQNYNRNPLGNSRYYSFTEDNNTQPILSSLESIEFNSLQNNESNSNNHQIPSESEDEYAEEFDKISNMIK